MTLIILNSNANPEPLKCKHKKLKPSIQRLNKKIKQNR